MDARVRMPEYSSYADDAQMPPDVPVAFDDLVVDYHIRDVGVIRVIGLVQLTWCVDVHIDSHHVRCRRSCLSCRT